MRFVWSALFLLLISYTDGWSAEGRADKDVGVNLNVGVPELMGIQFRYFGMKGFEFGLGYGSLPINRFLSSKVHLNSVPVDLQLPDSYALDPSVNFGLTAFNLHARFYPWQQGFFTEIAYQQLRFQANFQADLRNVNTGRTVNNVASGTLNLSQPILGPALGYQFFIPPGIYIDLSLGAGILFASKTEVTSGGTISNVLPVVPSAEASFEASRDQIKKQAEDEVAKMHQSVVVIPTLGFGVGYAF